MTPIHGFAASAATWQNFYVLVGTAAATLIGLMFVAVTFGAGLMSAGTTPQVRAWIDPPFAHFVTVLLAACLMLIPTMTPMIMGVALVAVTLMRAGALMRVRRQFFEAHQRYGDLELSDWITGLVLPALCYLGLIAAGVAFVEGWAEAFTGLAVIVVVVLLLGVFGAWELLIWLALTRVRSNDAGSGS